MLFSNTNIFQNDTAYVIGTTTWTRITSQYTPEEIECMNKRKAAAAAKFGKSIYPLDTSDTYTEVVLEDIGFISEDNALCKLFNPRAATSEFEKMIANGAFASKNGKLKISIKDHTKKSEEISDPTPRVTFIDDDYTATMMGSELEAELAPGTKVVLGLKAQILDNGLITTSIENVIVVKSPCYIPN